MWPEKRKIAKEQVEEKNKPVTTNILLLYYYEWIKLLAINTTLFIQQKKTHVLMI